MKIHKLHDDHSCLQEGEVILDVRTKEEFSESHIPGAKHIPHDEVQNHLTELQSYSKIYIHCRSGKRAQVATKILTDLGLKTLHCIDDSGMQHWVENGYPTAK